MTPLEPIQEHYNQCDKSKIENAYNELLSIKKDDRTKFEKIQISRLHTVLFPPSKKHQKEAEQEMLNYRKKILRDIHTLFEVDITNSSFDITKN